MAIKVAVGSDSFEAVIRSGSYYVDKSELIYDLVQKTDNTVTLFTRPRRFGKTLAMRMMESFFDITRDSRDLFQGLSVSGHTDFCKEWMNQYPVLFLSLKDVDGLNFESAYISLQDTISDLCIRHGDLAEHASVDPADKVTFLALKEKHVEPAAMKSVLKTIMRMMYAAYGKPVILLIDEYDVPLAKASEKNTVKNRYYEQMLDVIRGMLSSALKTNDYLKFAVITGCLRIAKESIFTGTNNFAAYSVLDERYDEYFGFRQDEVNAMLRAAHLTEKTDLFRTWYDGYVFGTCPVYCPWDVVSYVSDLLYKDTAKPKNYWRNTSGNGVIRDFVGRTDFKVSGKFETLMNGGTITEAIADELTYDTLHESERNLWSVLLMTGYLTKADPEEDGAAIQLKIPNSEIAGIFQDSVAGFFRDTLDQSRQKALMDALWSGEEDAASEAMSDLLWKTISYMDYHEDYYHAFLTGIFVGRGYETESNKEHGLGRPDILLKDEDHRRAIIIEAKKSTHREKMERDCAEALRQIQERQYAGSLTGYQQVFCYGISFFQKTALVKKL